MLCYKDTSIPSAPVGLIERVGMIQILHNGGMITEVVQ